jgi:hypothetical protein
MLVTTIGPQAVMHAASETEARQLAEIARLVEQLGLEAALFALSDFRNAKANDAEASKFRFEGFTK